MATVIYFYKETELNISNLEGTLQAVEMTRGAKSNTYDSIGNADVNFRRNTN